MIYLLFFPMKWYTSLLSMIVAWTSLLTVLHVHANIDDAMLLEHHYTCTIDRETQAPVWKLSLFLKYRWNTVIVKEYAIQNAWKVKSIINDDPSNWFWTFGIEESANISIPWCGCPSELTGATNYSSLVTKNQSGSVAEREYIFTIGSGSAREGARLADVIVLSPNLGWGKPRECGSGLTGTASPLVSLTVSENMLTGKIEYLTGDNAYSCLEILWKTTGSGAEWYCTNDASRWQQLYHSQSGWTFASGTWNLSTSVGSGTPFPANVYRWYFKNSTNNTIGKGEFQVGNGNGTPVVAFTVSGTSLTGTVKNLLADMSYACLVWPWMNTTCSSSTWSNGWIKMSSQSGWIYTGGVWYLTTRVGTGSQFPQGTYEWYWRNGTGGAVGKAWFVVDIASSDTTPRVSFTLSWNILTGTVTNLSLASSYWCTVNPGNTWSCTNDTRTNIWTRMVSWQQGWTYSGSTWYGRFTVWSGTEFGGGTHVWYLQEWTNGNIGSGSFTVWTGTSGSGQLPLITFVISGSMFTGRVENLSATNASACLEVFGRTTGPNAEWACRSGTGSDWVKMPRNGWTFNTASGVWEITRAIWPWTDMPNNRYAAFWKDDTTNSIGSWNFLVNVSEGMGPLVNISVMTQFGQSSTGMWQRLQWLTGTVSNLSYNNAYACLEVVGRWTGTNMDGYCGSDMTHWTGLPTQDWRFNTAKQVWEVSRRVGDGSDLPENTYRVFFKSGTGWGVWRGMFQVLVSKGLRIIGNVTWQWTLSYGKDTETSGNIVDETRMIALRNTLTSNIANLTRGVADGNIVNGVVQYHRDVRYSSLADKSFSTLIVYGTLIIDQNIDTLKWLIIMKDASGNKGNIIVENDVTYINALIYAEGILMGLSTNAMQANQDLQLVLKGILLSRNTVGGSADPESLFVYPHLSTPDMHTAFIHDLNTVRSWNGWRMYMNTYIDAFIIDYDPSILTNMPPWFSWL